MNLQTKLQALTMKDVLNVLSTYDIRHVPVLYESNKELGGLCVPSRNIILISDHTSYQERETAIIHEIVHGDDFSRRGHTSERTTDIRTKLTYLQLNGHYFGQ